MTSNLDCNTQSINQVWEENKDVFGYTKSQIFTFHGHFLKKLLEDVLHQVVYKSQSIEATEDPKLTATWRCQLDWRSITPETDMLKTDIANNPTAIKSSLVMLF